MLRSVFIFSVFIGVGCKGIFDNSPAQPAVKVDTVKSVKIAGADTIRTRNETRPRNNNLPPTPVSMKNVPVDSILNFAQTLIGTPYKYGSIDPAEGFDCSGFITYVYRHFNINVPRSSIDFTDVGQEVSVVDAKKGDLVLFRGTDSTERFVGHMGIIISNNNGSIQFIHASSGKANGVVITPLNDYYRGRFVKVVRIGAS